MGLRGRVLLLLGAVLALTIAAGVLLIMAEVRADQRHQYRLQGAHVLSMLDEAAADLQGGKDGAAAARAAFARAAFPSVRRVSVRLPSGQEVAAGPPVRPGWLVLRGALPGGGRGAVYLSRSREDALLRADAERWAAWGLGGLVLATGAAYWALDRLLLRRLRRLRRAVQRMAAGELGAALAPSGTDELAQVEEDVDRLRRTLGERLAELSQREEDFRTAVASLAEAAAGRLPLRQRCAHILEATIRATRAQTGAFFLAGQPGEPLEAAAVRGVPARAFNPAMLRREGRSHDPVFWRTGGEDEFGLGILLFAGSRELAALLVARRAAPFGFGEVEVLRVLADQAAVVLESARLEAALEEHLREDPGTGLPNYREMEEFLRQRIDRGEGLALVLLDIDHFRRLNARLGRPTGDAVLRRLARRVRLAAGPADLVARVGGDDLAVVLPGAGEAPACLAAERLRSAVEEMAWGELLEPEERITVSAGMAFFPASADNYSSLVQAAEDALFASKLLGGNCVSSYQPAYAALKELDPAQVQQQLRGGDPQTVRVLAAAVDLRDAYTARHGEAMAALAAAVGRRLGLSAAEQSSLRTACLLHDVGKIGIPDHILGKRGPLSAAERQVMNGHAQMGAELIGNLPALAAARLGVLHHHERWDGQGYPEGLAGEAIPLLARVVAVIDAYEAMTSDRPYRLAMDPAAAVAEMEVHASTQFDPRVVRALLEELAAWEARTG